nr:hypothetical protein [Pandoravirus massiliensis]
MERTTRTEPSRATQAKERMHQAAEEWLAATGLYDLPAMLCRCFFRRCTLTNTLFFHSAKRYDVFDDDGDQNLLPTQDPIRLGRCASIKEYHRRYEIELHQSATGALPQERAETGRRSKGTQT